MTIEENKAYICKTEETAKKFISLCESQNIIWGSGMPVKSSDNTNWDWFGDNTCYILVGGHLMFGPYPKWVDEFGYKPVYVDGNRPTKFVLDEKAMLCLQEAIVSQFCPDCDYCGYDVINIVKEVFRTHFYKGKLKNESTKKTRIADCGVLDIFLNTQN